MRDRLKVIAVGGACGKTPTSCLIAGVLGTAGHRTALLGKLGFTDGSEAWPLPRNPDSVEVLDEWLARANISGCTHAVLETGRWTLPAVKRLGVMFDTACVTRLSLTIEPDDEPFEDDGPFEMRLFERIQPDGVAVLNANDAGCEDLLARVDTPALTVGVDEPAEITANIVERTICGQTFLLSVDDEAVPVRVSLVGSEFVYHCLLAAAVGFAHGLDAVTIARGLESVECVPGRLQRVECGQPFSVFVDAAGRPERLAAALAELRPLTRGRMICAFGRGTQLDAFGRRRMAQTAEQYCDVSVITSDDGVSHVTHGAGDALAAFHVTSDARSIPNRREAIDFALNEARPGDCVLLAGGGADGWSFGGGPASDYEQARECLYAGVTCSAPYRAAA